MQKKWFHGKEKKELEQKIAGKQRELSKSKDTLSQIPRMNGYENALEVKNAYKSAKRELDKVRKQQNAWDQAMKPSEKMYLVIRANRPEQTKSRSVHGRLEEKKREAAQQQWERAKTEVIIEIAFRKTAGTVNAQKLENGHWRFRL